MSTLDSNWRHGGRETKLASREGKIAQWNNAHSGGCRGAPKVVAVGLVGPAARAQLRNDLVLRQHRAVKQLEVNVGALRMSATHIRMSSTRKANA